MAEESVKLFGYWASPFVNTVKWALKLKGIIHFEYVVEDLKNKGPLLLQYNPVLLHYGRPLAESLLIMEYIIDEI